MSYGLNPQDLNQITQALQQFPQIETALIFGSRAKGNYQPGSDIDLALKGRGITQTIVSQLSFLLNEEYLLPYFFDVLDYETINNQDLKAHIDRVGQVIYTKLDAPEEAYGSA